MSACSVQCSCEQDAGDVIDLWGWVDRSRGMFATRSAERVVCALFPFFVLQPQSEDIATFRPSLHPTYPTTSALETSSYEKVPCFNTSTTAAIAQDGTGPRFLHGVHFRLPSSSQSTHYMASS